MSEIGRLADVKAMTKLSRPTIDRLEKAGDFPRRIRLGKAAVGWDLAEEREWLNNRPRGPKAPQPVRMPVLHG
jgi:prophage regulatory protein